MSEKPYQLINETESFKDFNHLKLNKSIISSDSHFFHYFNSADCKDLSAMQYRKRDFFKISFLHGDYIVHFGSESIRVSGASFSIFHPSIPYTIETIKETNNGGYLIFTDLFYDNYFKEPISRFPLFINDKKTIYSLNQKNENYVKELFRKIETYSHSNYDQKHQMILNNISELLHFGNTIDPVSERMHVLSHKERLVKIFKEILESQFPVNSILDNGSLRSASDFSKLLNVHVNYLNRIIKETSGKSTTEHINERYLKESLILIKHSNWSISEIAYSLGFKDAPHFNHFFKSMTNAKPSDYRK